MYLQVRAIRLKRGWSQGELARRSGCPQPTVCLIEKGKCPNVSVLNAWRLARALKCTVDDLIVVDEEDARQGERREGTT